MPKRSVPGSVGAHVFILLVVLAASLFAAASAGAQSSPFGEPELVLDLSNTFPNADIQGTFSIHPDGVFFLQLIPTFADLEWLVAGDTEGGGRSIWRTDGTPAGTEVAFETCPGDCSDLASVNQVEGGPLVLMLNDPAIGTELHTSDGTLEGTELLVDLCPGPCSPGLFALHEQNGYGLFLAFVGNLGAAQLWATDFTPGNAWQITDFSGGVGFGSRFPSARVGDRVLISGRDGATAGLWSVALPTVPAPPPGDWLASPQVPGYSFKVRFSTPSGSLSGAREAECVEETACFSGALPGRSEVFARVVGPKPNGKLWPTIVKFTTSTVEVWVEQVSTNTTKFYSIEGAAPGKDDLTGLFDRQGFEP